LSANVQVTPASESAGGESGASDEVAVKSSAEGVQRVEFRRASANAISASPRIRRRRRAFGALKAAFVALRMTRPRPVATFHLAIKPVARSYTMNSLRLFVLTAACAVLATPVAGVAAPAESSAACMAPRLSLVQRRVSEEAARGLPTLISFVNRTQPIYQLRLVDAVDMVDAERERRSQCVTASASAISD
jgi:hypothetical protein